MHGFIEKVKEHPWIAALIAVVVGVALLFFLTRGSVTTAPVSTSNNDDSAVTAATAYQIATLQMQSANHAADTQAAEVDSVANAQVQMAALTAATTQNANALAAVTAQHTADTTLAATQSTNDSATQIAGLEAATLKQQYDDAMNTQINNNITSVQLAQVAGNNAANMQTILGEQKADVEANALNEITVLTNSVGLNGHYKLTSDGSGGVTYEAE